MSRSVHRLVYYSRNHVRGPLDAALREKADDLAARVSRQELVLFLGAGVSQAAGLPTWGGLLGQLAGADLASDPDFVKLGALDQARVVQALLPEGSATAEMLIDYAVMRDQARACR